MRRHLRWLAAASPLLLALSSANPALGQKSGGILNISHFDSPASMSLHEEATAAGIARAIGFRLVAGLPVPCAAARDAATADRHRPVQICRVQAERAHQGGEEPGLLETGPALSRRHRLDHHQGSGDAGAIL